MDTSTIEAEVRTALRAAASGVHPQARPLPARIDGSARSPRTSRRRWLAPAVAAAAVAAIGVPVLLMSALRGGGDAAVSAAKPGGPDTAATSVVTVSAGRATVAGISFPVPDGWTAKAVAQTDTSVTVCVAAQPSTACDGVTLRIALPDAAGRITPVRDPLTAEDPLLSGLPLMPADDPSSSVGIAPSTAHGEPAQATAASTAGSAAPVSQTLGNSAEDNLKTAVCPMIEDTDPIGGRPAVHYSIGFCAAGSPQSADWYVTDGSLAISTPRGIANSQAAVIAAGLDFSAYHHAYGPQILFMAEPPGSSSTVSPTR